MITDSEGLNRGVRSSAAIVIYYVLLSLAVFILPHNVGMNDVYLKNWNVINFAIGVAIMAVSGFLVSLFKEDSHKFWMFLILYICLCPAIVLTGSGNLSARFPIIVLSSIFLVMITVRAVGLIEFTSKRCISHRKALLATTVIVLIYASSVAWIVGLSSLNLNVSEIYETRARSAASLPAGFGYLSGAFTGAVIPLGIVLALSLRSWRNLILLIVAAMVPAILLGHKSMAILPIAVAALYVIMSFRIWPYIIFGVVCSLLIVSVVDILAYKSSMNPFGAPWISSIFMRRALMVPSILNNEYIEYFYNGPYYWWSTSKLTLGFLTRPYEHVASVQVGLDVYGSVATIANTGFIGSGYAQGGIVGTAIYSVAIGILISVAVAVARRQSLQFSMMFVPLIVTAILTSDFPTVILSHGGWMAILISLAVSPSMKRR